VADGRVEVLGEEQVPEVVDGERGPPEPRCAAAVLQDPVDDLLGVLATAGRPRCGEVATEVVDAHVGRAGGVAGEERAHVVGRGRVLEREPAREEDAAPVRPHLGRRPVALVPGGGVLGGGEPRGEPFSRSAIFSRREVSGKASDSCGGGKRLMIGARGRRRSSSERGCAACTSVRARLDRCFPTGFTANRKPATSDTVPRPVQVGVDRSLGVRGHHFPRWWIRVMLERLAPKFQARPPRFPLLAAKQRRRFLLSKWNNSGMSTRPCYVSPKVIRQENVLAQILQRYNLIRSNVFSARSAAARVL
jgi:hypothetical protein